MQSSFLVFDSKTGCFPWFCLSLHTLFGHWPWIVCLSLHIWKCWDMPSPFKGVFWPNDFSKKDLPWVPYLFWIMSDGIAKALRRQLGCQKWISIVQWCSYIPATDAVLLSIHNARSVISHSGTTLRRYRRTLFKKERFFWKIIWPKSAHWSTQERVSLRTRNVLVTGGGQLALFYFILFCFWIHTVSVPITSGTHTDGRQ